MPQSTAIALINLVDELFNGLPQSHPDRLNNIRPGLQNTKEEISMNDHCGHSKHAPVKTESTSKSSTPTPVEPDAHAGHDMGKPEAPADLAKPGDKK